MTARNHRGGVVLVHVPKVARIDGQIDRFGAMSMPMGLLALAALLDREGVDCTVVHLGIELQRDPLFRLDEWIVHRAPILVGFSLHWHLQLADVLSEAERVDKALPSVPIVVGGFTATAFAEELLASYPAIDYVLRGDAERGLLELVQALTQEASPWEPETISNLAWRQNDVVVAPPLSFTASSDELSALNFSRIDLLHHRELLRHDPVGAPGPPGEGPRKFYLSIGRGCSFTCAFCSGSRGPHERLTGRSGPTFRSPESVTRDVRRLLEQGVDELHLCYQPSGRETFAWYQNWFGQLRHEGLRPGLTFECFGAPPPEFFDDLADTFDRERSTVLLSPGSADEEVRRRFQGPSYSDTELHRVLEHCRGLGIHTHVCASLYPGDGWPEARKLRDWLAVLRAAYHCTTVVSPIEVEPLSPWQTSPARYGLQDVRTGLAAYVERHQRPGLFERDWDAELGYTTRDVGARTMLLGSDEPLRWAWPALTGLGGRAILTPTSALDRVLDFLPPLLPGRATAVISGDPTQEEHEQLARKIATRSRTIDRIVVLRTSAAPGWPSVPHETRPLRRWRQATVAFHPVVLAQTADVAELIRQLEAQGRDFAQLLRQRFSPLVDACRFAGRPCPASLGLRLCSDGAGDLSGCASLRLEADDWTGALAAIARRVEKIERERGCGNCPVRHRCTRCPAPAPLEPKQYCALVQSLPTLSDFARDLAHPPPPL